MPEAANGLGVDSPAGRSPLQQDHDTGRDRECSETVGLMAGGNK